MSSPNLNVIPFSVVEAAIAVAAAADVETTKFNTHFHTHAEIASAIPVLQHHPSKHVYPDLTASHFGHWIDLVASSQGFHEWHKITLPATLVQELFDANTIWTLTGNAIKPDAMEDLLARFPKWTCHGIGTQAVFDGQKEWFLRLDSCSTKDAIGEGGVRYSSSIRTVADALQRICASKRAIRALEDLLLEESPGLASLFFIPYNRHMDTVREFRVFCPPVWSLSALSNQLIQKHHDDAPTKGQSTDGQPLGRITAISQYRWHPPYHRPSLPAAQADAEKALAAATSIHSQIQTYAATMSRLTGVQEKLLNEGFVFDIFESLNGSMQLLEINPFGAMSGCGSCLFQWIVDARLLYGALDEVEVRLTM